MRAGTVFCCEVDPPPGVPPATSHQAAFALQQVERTVRRETAPDATRPLTLNATGLPDACQPGRDLPLRRIAAGQRPDSAPASRAPIHAWMAVCCSGRCQARRASRGEQFRPSRTVWRQRGSVPVSRAGSSGVRARGSVLQDCTRPSATWTMSSSTSQTAKLAGAPGTSWPGHRVAVPGGPPAGPRVAQERCAGGDLFGRGCCAPGRRARWTTGRSGVTGLSLPKQIGTPAE